MAYVKLSLRRTRRCQSNILYEPTKEALSNYFNYGVNGFIGRVRSFLPRSNVLESFGTYVDIERDENHPAVTLVPM